MLREMRNGKLTRCGCVVKTIEQLKEGFKALSERLHQVKVEHEEMSSVIMANEGDGETDRVGGVVVQVRECKQSEEQEDDEEIGKLERWSDDEGGFEGRGVGKGKSK